jgi:hypothetical protein
MPELFKRAWRLQIGQLLIDASTPANKPLSIRFKVMKSVKKEPNTIELDVMNLSKDHRGEIESAKDVQLQLSAGYVDNIQVIFDGSLRLAKNKKKRKNTASVKRIGLEVITEIEGEDGGTAYRDAFVSASFPAGTPVTSVFKSIIREMGIGEGNLVEFSRFSSIRGIGNQYQEGTVVHGKAHREMNRLVKALGLTWSVQNGNLQLLEGGKSLQETAVRLTPSSGLIGSPSKENDGSITCTALLIPDLYPGRKVVIDARDVDVQAIIQRVTYNGDTAGAEWYAQMELKEY